MNRIGFTEWLILATCFLSQNSLAANHWPTITGETSTQACSDAFVLANSIFKSTARRLYGSINIPDGMQSEFILGTKELDISGGDPLENGKKQFDVISLNTAHNIYWAKNTDAGFRVAIEEMRIGWRGNMYSVHLLDKDVVQQDFLKSTENTNISSSKYKTLISDTWRPPLIFQIRTNSEKWFIDVGQPFEQLANWDIYGITVDGFKRTCIISFHPEVPNIASLLPLPVQDLVQTLDETIGPGIDEGTLQSTAHLRTNVRHVLANVALRPWSLSESEVYNSREEVELELRNWAKTAPRKLLHKRILRQYPLAEKSLTTYYVTHFQLPQEKAQKVATWVLDIILRSNYVFTTDGDYFRYNNVNTNPW